MFRSIHIQNFRGFEDLALHGLGRVNLVVGKNNTGKTALLEAITLLSGKVDSLPGLFRANVGRVGDHYFRWLLRDGAGPSSTSLRGTSRNGEESHLSLTKGNSDRPEQLRQVWNKAGYFLWSRPNVPTSRIHAVSVQHRAPDSMVSAFAEAVRAPRDERQLESMLGSVDPRIKSVRLDAVDGKPLVAVDIGLSERVPLPQAGQGIYRLVAIFSELLGNKPNVCLIDEIENGIHYSAHASVWKGIAEVAERLEIQVFATTHSRECLVAAHEAFTAREGYDLTVIQLDRLGDTTKGRVLDREQIEAAIVSDIEVR